MVDCDDPIQQVVVYDVVEAGIRDHQLERFLGWVHIDGFDEVTIRIGVAGNGLSDGWPKCLERAIGSRDDRVWRVVQENGYVTIYWTYHVWDWTEDRTAEKVYSSAIEGACNGAIVVMHVGAWETADMLPAIIDELRARGYRLVTLSELLSP